MVMIRYADSSLQEATRRVRKKFNIPRNVPVSLHTKLFCGKASRWKKGDVGDQLGACSYPILKPHLELIEVISHEDDSDWEESEEGASIEALSTSTVDLVAVDRRRRRRRRNTVPPEREPLTRGRASL